MKIAMHFLSAATLLSAAISTQAEVAYEFDLP